MPQSMRQMAQQKRYKYYYDHAGNLTSWRIEDGTATNTQEEHTYTYGDSNWKDLLTAFDGKAITYDANGNPTKYYNGGTMTWRNGRSWRATVWEENLPL